MVQGYYWGNLLSKADITGRFLEVSVPIPFIGGIWDARVVFSFPET